MKISEILNLSKEITESLNEVRSERKLSFEEKNHKYSIYSPIEEKIIKDLPSVSTLLKQWYEPFDSLSKSIEMMSGDVDLASDLRKQWQKKGEDANSIGSFTHYKLEKYVWDIFDIQKTTRKPFYNLKNEELYEAQKMVKTGVGLIHKIIDKGFVPLETESVMGSIDLGYFGQSDNLWLGHSKTGLKIIITDYKTNKTKKFKKHRYNKPMKEPFGDLFDTDLSKYYIQQSLYRQLLKDMLKKTPYKDIPITSLYILHLRDKGRIIKVPQWVGEKVSTLYPIY